jgi:hypothetical protein
MKGLGSKAVGPGLPPEIAGLAPVGNSTSVAR